ncbi:MAG: vitamin B12-dependent ribonucleotide reductase [Candidatus Sungbacteria bacterium]|uniref:Vitamin B12-dependent ribonucleotide reductase n=1 Tax=Candidatus Sungiibacteriota bacterium TaxID=2750080 RepID=A0A9D6LQE2_9BACT|nr:vitamin B12-dependent ribonucleotide reductase [Candidatus Sungbacteria bacterium]
MPQTKVRTDENRSSLDLPAARFLRVYTKEGAHPYDEVGWVWKKVTMKKADGTTVETENEFPDFWSDNAVQIAVTKYFKGKADTATREKSLKQLIDRVVRTIVGWGQSFGHFKSKEEAKIFGDELTYILLHQHAAFNSPVWFNLGIYEKPQCSACFILKVDDSMESILEWIRTEGMIFKMGSGSGVNLSQLRSSREPLSKGGRSSGPMSFMRGADSVAGMIKSGGTTRRAAKMVILNIDHPDIVEFIKSKAEEEKKVRALSAAGYDMADLNHEAWNSIQYQNANNSVRVTDEFMRAFEVDGEFHTKYRTTGEIADTHRARDLMQLIAEAAWGSGDPGMMFDDTANDWNTAANTARINATNPCAEYQHIDNSACNLASINLLKYLRDDNTFNADLYRHTIRIMISAQEILVDGSSYPTEAIAKNTHDFRQLGLGYANLGALLMSMGYAYDSEESVAWTGALTAIMTGEAYRQSAVLASRVGPFAGFEINKKPMLRVLEKHRAELAKVKKEKIHDQNVFRAAKEVWDEAVKLGKQYGVRNAQATVIAPTGTISFMMDCDTTGIEPVFAHIAMKQLVGGGYMKIVNRVVPRALKTLGYSAGEIEDMLHWVEEKGTIEGAPHLKDSHLPIFDAAVAPGNGKRSIAWPGHVRVVAAAQSFISGAISKTFNMPYETTPEEIMDSYVMAWKMGIKAFAIYRDGSKGAQPLATISGKGGQQTLKLEPQKRALPTTRQSETHKFSIAGHDGYLTYSMFEDGTLAEIFIRIAKQGSTLAGLLDVFALSISIALRYGVPLKELASKYIYGRYEPAGVTENPDIPVALSITDYIFRYLAYRFLPKESWFELGIDTRTAEEHQAAASEPLATLAPITKIRDEIHAAEKSHVRIVFSDTVCRMCGGMMVQTGSCKTCLQCGMASGGC